MLEVNNRNALGWVGGGGGGCGMVASMGRCPLDQVRLYMCTLNLQNQLKHGEHHFVGQTEH